MICINSVLFKSEAISADDSNSLKCKKLPFAMQSVDNEANIPGKDRMDGHNAKKRHLTTLVTHVSLLNYYALFCGRTVNLGATKQLLQTLQQCTPFYAV